MKKYILIAVAVVWVLGVSISEAQQQWLPGMLKDGYVLCQDGMGRSVVNPNAPAIAWSEVVGKSARTKSALADQVALSTATKPASSAPVETVRTVPIDDSVEKSPAKGKSVLTKEGEVLALNGEPIPEAELAKHFRFDHDGRTTWPQPWHGSKIGGKLIGFRSD